MDPDAYIDAVSATLGLPIAEDHRPGVVRFLHLAAEMAGVLASIDLHDEEPGRADVFFLRGLPGRNDA